MYLSVARSLAVAFLRLVFAACGGSPLSTLSGPAEDWKRVSPTAASSSEDCTVVLTAVSSSLVTPSVSPPTSTRSTASSAIFSVTTTVPAALTAPVAPVPVPWPVVTSMTATVTPMPMLSPTLSPTATFAPSNDTHLAPTTAAGALAVNIGLLETVPGTDAITVGPGNVGGGSYPAGTTVTVARNLAGSIAPGVLGVAYEYNGTEGWFCASTSCAAVNGLPGNPVVSHYQVALQTRRTLISGTTTLCTIVANTGDANSVNDTWCETLP